jgi:hypothetical protein
LEGADWSRAFALLAGANARERATAYLPISAWCDTNEGGLRMSEERRTTTEQARRVGDEIGVDWDRFDLEQFRFGMDVEFEHGSHDPQTNVTGDDPILTGKIALAHLKEFPDYYERLERMEQEAERDWATRRDRE